MCPRKNQMKSNKLAWYWIWKTPALLLPSWPPCLGLPSHKSNPFWLSTLHWKFNHRCCNIWIMNLHSCKELKFKLIPPLLMNQISGEVELFFSRINISFNEESSALIFQGNRHRFEFSRVGFYRWDHWLFLKMWCCCLWVDFSLCAEYSLCSKMWQKVVG